MFVLNIVGNDLLQKLIPLQAADEGTRVPIAGDIGGIARDDITHQLVDGIIALGLKGAIHPRNDGSGRIRLFLNGRESHGFIHIGHLLHILYLTHGGLTNAFPIRIRDVFLKKKKSAPSLENYMVFTAHPCQKEKDGSETSTPVLWPLEIDPHAMRLAFHLAAHTLHVSRGKIAVHGHGCHCTDDAAGGNANQHRSLHMYIRPFRHRFVIILSRFRGFMGMEAWKPWSDFPIYRDL